MKCIDHRLLFSCLRKILLFLRKKRKNRLFSATRSQLRCGTGFAISYHRKIQRWPAHTRTSLLPPPVRIPHAARLSRQNIRLARGLWWKRPASGGSWPSVVLVSIKGGGHRVTAGSEGADPLLVMICSPSTCFEKEDGDVHISLVRAQISLSRMAAAGIESTPSLRKE